MRPGRIQWLLAAVVWPALGTAQITSDRRLGTTVTPVGNSYTINGGTTSGSNLFHSFDKFSVPTLGSAIFNGPPATQNVISRVTGGQLSSIDGTVSTLAGTSPMRSANFFFINPSGFSFGPNAKLDIGGAVHISTAENIQLSDGTMFSVKPAPGEVLTSAPPQAFGFLGNNPAPIAFDHAQLSVTPGQTLSLIGGNVQVNNGALIAARGGLVQIVSVASSGNVVLGAAELGTGAFSHLGQVIVSGDGVITAAPSLSDALRPGGTVFIRSGELIVDRAQIVSDNIRATGAPIGVDIRAANSLTLRNAALLQTSSKGPANASGISIIAGDVSLRGKAAIQSIGFLAGGAGAIDIQAARADLADAAIQTRSNAGNGGDIRIKASGSVTLSGPTTEIASGGGAGRPDPKFVAGNISVVASNVTLRDAAMIRSGSASEQGGDSVSVTASNVVSISGLAGISSWAISHTVGGVTISAAELAMDGGYINTSTLGNLGGGRITVNAGTVNLTNGAQIASSSQIVGSGAGGSIQLNAGSVSLSGIGPANGVGSIIFTGSPSSGLFSTTVGRGNAGHISVAAPSLTIADGAKISVTSTGAGNAGTISMHGDTLNLSDGAVIESSTTSAGAGGAISVDAGNVSLTGAGTALSSTAGGTGNAGRIALSGSSLSVADGAKIAVTTSGAGDAGSITANVGDVTLNGGQIASSTTGLGAGGSIAIQAPSVSLTGANAGLFSTASSSGTAGTINIGSSTLAMIDGAKVSASTIGSGNAGRISARADTLSLANGAAIESSTASGGAGGSISIDAPRISLTGVGTALSSTAGGSGNAGQITLNASTLAVGDGAGVSVSTTGSGNAGTVTAKVTDITLDGGQMASSTAGIGAGGALAVTASSVSIAGANAGLFSTASNSGNAGTITIASPMLTITDAAKVSASTSGTGNAGTILAHVDTLRMSSGGGIESSTSGGGAGGSVSVEATGVSLTGRGTALSSTAIGDGNAGQIRLTASNLGVSDGAKISATTSGVGNAGTITANVPTITLNGGQITSSTTGAGAGGAISLAASNVSITGSGAGLFNTASSTGNAGTISIVSPTLAISDGAKVSVSTAGSGSAGSISTRGDALTISGGSAIESSTTGGGAGGSINVDTSRVSITGTGTALSSTAGGTGNAGQITIGASSLSVADGAKISVSTNAAGNAGTVTATAGTVSLNGAQIDSRSSGAGGGGAINITSAREVLIKGGRISADSTGTGRTGNITVAAGNRIMLNGGTISTRALTSDGGDITLKAPQFMRLERAQVTTSVQSGSGSGGNIFIDPQFLIANDSTITANAFGGRGGNITLIADVFVPSATTLLEASSALSTPGTIRIVSPENNIAGSISQLPRAFVDASRLMRGACSARREGAPSSFTLAGRGGVPPDADGYLPSWIAGAPSASIALARLDDCAR